MAREIKNWLIIALTILIIALLLAKSCDNKIVKKVTITKKQGKTELVKQTTKITFDTLKWIATYKANTKPAIVYRWLKPKPTHDTTERQPNYVYSPCDSVFNSEDTGSIEGVKYAIVDTISDNRVIGRSIAFDVPQSIITKNTVNTNDSLRVDTFYVTTKQKWGTNAKWFFKGFAIGNATGFVAGSFVPR
jgi:hypothetical protein